MYALIPRISSTVPATGTSRVRRRPSMTSIVMVTPGLTLSRSANGRARVIPSGASAIGRRDTSRGWRSSGLAGKPITDVK
jgi:hypothetical protein